MNESVNIDYSVVSAFEKSKQKPAKTFSSRTFGILLYAVFFIVMMICLSFGITLYQNVANMRAQADDLHMQSGLLTNIVHVNDAADAVERGTGPEGDALVLVERIESGTYETRVYLHDGAIVQEYAISGRPYNPDGAIEITSSSTFEFDIEGSLLTLTTDDGTFNIALRSSQTADQPASDQPALVGTANAARNGGEAR